MKQDPSRDQLTRSLDRRIKHLMIRVLEKFEDRFPDVDDTRDGQVFKGDLRTAFNDVIRAQRDELRDYDIDYRPLKLTDDNILAMTQTFMQTVRGVNFGFSEESTLSTCRKPFIEFYASLDKRMVLEALRAEIETGVISERRLANGEIDLMLQIVGVQSCVDCVLPIMDRYRLHASVNQDYSGWRDKVVKFYRS